MDGTLVKAIEMLRLEHPKSTATEVHTMLQAQPAWETLGLSEVKRTCSKMAKAGKTTTSPPSIASPDVQSKSYPAPSHKKALQDGLVWAGLCATMIEAELLRRQHIMDPSVHAKPVEAEMLRRQHFDPLTHVFALDLRVERGKPVLMHPETKKYLEPDEVLAKAKVVRCDELERVLVEDMRFGASWAKSQAAAFRKAHSEWAAQPVTPRESRERGSLKLSEIHDTMVILAVGDVPPAHGRKAPSNFMHTASCHHLITIMKMQQEANASARKSEATSFTSSESGAIKAQSMKGDFEGRRCGICHETAHVQACLGCKTVFYCSKAHQKGHWKASHKQSCKHRKQLTAVLASQLGSMVKGQAKTTPEEQAISMICLLSDEQVIERLASPFPDDEQDRGAARLAFFKSKYSDIALSAMRNRCLTSLASESLRPQDVPVEYLPDSSETKKEKGLRRTRAFMLDIDMSKVTDTSFGGMHVWDLSDYRFICYSMPDDFEYQQHKNLLRQIDPAQEFGVRITNDGRAPALIASARFDGIPPDW